MKQRIEITIEKLASRTYSIGEAVSAVNELRHSYPFFIAPSVLLLKNYLNELTETHRNEVCTTIALNSSDKNLLFSLVEPNVAAEFSNFYPLQQKQKISTTDAISTFLATYGEEDPGESALLEKLIFNPVGDYSARLEKEQNEKPNVSTSNDETFRRIESFMAAHPETTPVVSEASAPTKSIPRQIPTPSQETLLSESLAKIYIKQQRFDKAYEIITQLSLNYPEKSCYFADQLRFLKKLIINQRYKN